MQAYSDFSCISSHKIQDKVDNYIGSGHINKFTEVTDDVAKEYLKEKKTEAVISLAIECKLCS